MPPTGRAQDRYRLNASTCLATAILLGASANISQAQGQAQPDHPAVTVHGQTYTPRSILARNMGTEEDQTTAFTPHKIIGNVYYVGTRTLSSFLVATPQGHVLIDSTYERNVAAIQKSVEQLGFKFSDVRILLGNHAHGDHQEGDALVKQLTGGDLVKARFLYQNFFQFSPSHTIFLAANHKPVIRGTDHGNWRRIKLVPFTVTTLSLAAVSSSVCFASSVAVGCDVAGCDAGASAARTRAD